MTTETLEHALSSLWRKSRFASYFYQTVEFISNRELPTLALTVRAGKMVLYFNPDFFESITRNETIGLLIHEMMHVVLNHDHRSLNDENVYLQNCAQDMVVNSYLSENRERFFSKKDDYSRDGLNLELPNGLPMVPQRFYEESGISDPSWESLFRWLRDLPVEELNSLKMQTGQELGFPLDNQSTAGMLNESFSDTGIASFFYDSARSITFEGTRGLVFTDDSDRIIPSGVHLFQDRNDLMALESKRNNVMSMAGKDCDCQRERLFQEIAGMFHGVKESDTSSWQQMLKSVIDFSSQTSEWTYTYGRFNRRYFGSGIYAPGRAYKEQVLITIAVDVSGSMVMNPDDIGMAFGVIEDLLGKYRISLLCMDEDLFIPEILADGMPRSNALSRPYFYKKGDWKYLKTGSGGTTLFAPLFNHHMRGHREALLVITDGYIFDIEHLKRYNPTVWLVTGGRTEPFLPPFGRCVVMQDNKIT